MCCTHLVLVIEHVSMHCTHLVLVIEHVPVLCVHEREVLAARQQAMQVVIGVGMQRTRRVAR